MSVICFTMKELAEAEGQVLRAARNRSSSVFYAVRYSPPAAAAERFEKDEEKLIEELVGRLFWYVSVANKIAYALQYREEPGLFEEEGVKAIERTPNYRDLRKRLSSINYNLDTNDGNNFLGPDWRELWDRVRNAVNEEILKGIDRREEVYE